MNTRSQESLQGFHQTQTSLKVLAQNASFSRKVNPVSTGGLHDCPMGESVRIFAPKMKGCIWGKCENLTMSLLKTDVFDRRFIRPEPYPMEKVVRGAYSEANKNFDDMPYWGKVRCKFGVLAEEGGRIDHYAWSENYSFPCQKTVGQIIVKAPDFAGTHQPEATQMMQNGMTQISLENPRGGMLGLSYLMSMTRNLIAVKADYRNLGNALAFRLYRHRDQAHRRYMDENGNFIPKEQRRITYFPADGSKQFRYYDFEADAAINGPFEPPKSGREGRFFWICQRFPAEKTFPDGFQYVMMGLLSEPQAVIETADNQKGMGTPQYAIHETDESGRILQTEEGKMLRIYRLGGVGFEMEYAKQETGFRNIRNAPGSAATCHVTGKTTGESVLYVAVITSNETQDIFGEAKRQLLEAEALGFERLAAENRDWYDTLYDKREQGRIIIPGGDQKAVDDIMLADAYTSWSYRLGGYCLPDPSRFEGSASYAAFDNDTHSWHSLPCYNEIFDTGWVVRNRPEPLYMWAQLTTFWHEALKGKARDVFGLPGIAIAHGYLPPATPDPWYIENQALDYTIDSFGQVAKIIWDLWDYQGDEAFLRESAYPILRDLAIFYEAFARRGYNGKVFNLSPAVETENWGISYGLKYATNTTAAITVVRKILNCAIEGARHLGVDQDLIAGWKEVADHLPPFPRYHMGTGDILGGNSGAIPRWTAGDHGHFTASYTVAISDEINLDSTQDDKDLMIRSMDCVRCEVDDSVYSLLGALKEYSSCGYNYAAQRIVDEKQFAAEVVKVPERLVNSRSGRIHLFPAIPDGFPVAFRGFLARGGFEVSAARDASGVTGVVIKARRSRPCNLMNPRPGRPPVLTDLGTGESVRYTVDESNGQCICFEAEAGHSYSMD
ncbi:MAG: glycoside hydrolase family 95-like protein [Spirochaetia bacterium]|jgi:hypothetical protein